jgi:hypothetical protein
MNCGMPFKEWKQTVVNLAKTKFVGLPIRKKDYDWDAWREMYYNEGMTPCEAIVTELQSA